MNTITLQFRSRNCNGFPKAKILLDDTLVHDHQFSTGEESLSVVVNTNIGNHVLTVERYGKQPHNMVILDGAIIEDQILEITDILVDGVSIPVLVIDRSCEFKWDDNTHVGSRYFGPNGLWTYRFSTPLITHILDQRIEHESQFDQDYQFDWSYKHGPGTVDAIIKTIDQIKSKVNEIL